MEGTNRSLEFVVLYRLKTLDVHITMSADTRLPGAPGRNR